MDEQQALAAAARINHKERTLMLGRGLTEEDAHWQFLRLLARQVPGKSAAECGQCLKHVNAKRIAYFGPLARSVSPVRESRSPARSSAPSRTGSAASSDPPPMPPMLRTASHSATNRAS